MLTIDTPRLRLTLETTETVLARIDAMGLAERAEVSSEWLARLRATPPGPWTHGFAIVERDSGTTVGSCGFKGPPDPEGMVEIAYGVDPVHQRQGFAKEAAAALIHFARGAGTARVRAHTLPGNGPSPRVLRACGFGFVGEVVDPEDGLVWRWEYLLGTTASPGSQTRHRPMHPRTRELLEYLASQRNALRASIGEVPEPLRSREPSPERWSVAQIVEHLAVVQQRVLQVLAAHLSPEGLRDLPDEGDTSSVLPMLDLGRLLDRTARLTAGEASQPREGLGAEEAWARLTEQRRDVEEYVRAADGRALGAVSVPHPRLGTLDLYQWLLFLGAHEARHAAQIREVVRELADRQPGGSISR